MTRPAPRFHSPSRAAGISDAEARKAWVAVLRAGRVLATLAAGGGRVGAQNVLELRAQLVRLKAPFPLRFVSARAGAEAFLIAARAFVAAECAPALARSVAALAEDLTDMLDAETRAAFARSCRAVGDAD